VATKSHSQLHYNLISGLQLWHDNQPVRRLVIKGTQWSISGHNWVGCGIVLEGCFSIRWHEEQDIYWKAFKSRKSSKWWTMALMKCLILTDWGMWQHRNIISVLDQPEIKIIDLVLRLRALPVGTPKEVMMTMTTSPADPTSSQRPTTPTSIDKCSPTWTATTVANSEIRYIASESNSSSNVLRTIPTGKIQNTAATIVVSPPADDEIRYPFLIECINTLTPTDRQAWEEFFTEFENSTTYALAHSIDTIDVSSVTDDDDDDHPMSEGSDTPLSNDSFSASIRQLNHAIKELEKVNIQLFRALETLDNHDPPPPPFRHFAIPPQPQPQPYPAPHCNSAPQRAPPTAPPAPNPDAIPPQQPTNHSEPQSERIPRLGPEAMSLDYGHEPKNVSPCQLPLQPPIKKTTIPNWAKPAVPPLATNQVVGAFCTGTTHWPPPRPDRKTTPFKKKTQTKSSAADRIREKDSLRPP